MTARLVAALPAVALFSLVPGFVGGQRQSTVATLNRVTFNGNVFGYQEGEGPDGFVVLFCAEWFETCQNFEATFLDTAATYGSASQDDLFNARSTRFAKVDCAVDKVLCNSQDVEAYPTAVHYRRGGRAGEWSQSGRPIEKEVKSFKKWLDKQMQETDKPAEPKAVVDESASPAAPGVVAKFTSGVPLKQALPMMVALAAAGLWLARLAAELKEGLQLLREPGLPPAAERKPAEEDEAAAMEQPLVHELPAIVRCLTEEWSRATIEL